MSDIPIVSKIPTTNVADGTRVSDINGIVYSYNAATDTWIQNGVIKTPPVVTESQNGLVYPALYRKLNLIKLLKESGINWDNFQFATNNGFKPYFYYFNSSDGLIKFIPESTNRLRIEIDRPKLYSRILGLCCVGPKGDTGPQGLAGDNGKLAANEPKFTTSIKSDGSYQIDAKVNTPIDTKISVRFFNNKDILISEILIDLDGTITIDDTIESSAITLTKSSGSVTIKGSVTFVDSQDSLYYKARQVGPTGKDGEDGLGSIEIIEDIFSDAGVQSADALITVRKSGVDDNLTFVKQEMFTKNIFSSISGITDLPLDDVQNVEYVSLRVNTDDCKDIGKFKFIPPSLGDVTLNIPSWSPMCNCTDTFRYQIQKFDWYKNIPSQLPFTLIQEPPPPEKCCVDGDTLIHTDKGLVPIKNIKIGTNVMNPNGEFNSVTEIFNNGVKECVKLKFSDGTDITCTNDHKFLSAGILIEAQNLQLGDQVYKAPGVKLRKVLNIENFNYGYIVGFMYGDGYMNNNGIGICAPCYEEDSFNYIYNLLSAKFGINKISHSTTKYGCEMLNCKWTSKKAINYFSSNNLYKSKPKISVPNWMYTQDLDFYNGLLVAAINTDGCIDKYGNINIICSIYEDLALMYKQILDYLGIKSTFKKHKRKEGNGFENAKEYIYRVDVLNDKKLLDFIDVDKLTHHKKQNIVNIKFKQDKIEKIELPISINTDEYDNGLLNGFFTYLGGYNKKTKRAWISKKPDANIRNEISNILNIKINTNNTQYLKNVDLYDKVYDTKSYAIGYLKSCLNHRKVNKHGVLNINITKVNELLEITKCFDLLNIEYTYKSIKNQYRIYIKQSHSLYKLLILTNKKQSSYKKSLSDNIIELVGKEEVGLREVFDYTVPPSYMMVANGMILFDCQEDFYFCPNQGDLCGVVGLPTAPVRVPMQSDIQLKKHENGSSGVTDSGSIPSDSPPFVPCNLIPQNDIELDGDGVILPIILDDGENISESVVVNRGKSDQYTQVIEFTEFNSEFTINVDIQIGNRDGTFEGGTSFVVPIDNPAGEPTQEQLDNQCALHSSSVLTINGGAIAMILPSPSQEVQHDSIQNGGNSIKRITYTGLAMSAGSSVKLFVNINDTLLNCCLPYAIKTSVSTVVSDSGADNPGSGSSAASGDDDDDDDFIDNDIAPATDSPLIRTPEVPVIRSLINPPDVGGDENDVFANAAAGDVPMEPEYAWRPVAINRPVLQDLIPQISGMLIGETNREIEVNANLSDRIIIDIATPSDNTDPRSVTFPINGDPTVGEMLWTVSRIEFERNGSYLPNGPLGTGFYFLQKSNFVVSSRFTKLNNIQTRTDTFGNGFLYISGTSLSNVNGPSNMSIVSYGIDWTTNNFVNNISGFGSNWIRQVNRGVEEVGDALFQLIIDSELNIVRDISTAQKVSYIDAFVSLLYNPFGCATINIPQTVTSISSAILGGRCEEASEPAGPVGPVQTATISFDPVSGDILEDEPSMSYTMNVVMTTSDGLPLEQGVSVNIADSGLGTAVDGVDYTFSDDTITWAIGTPSGTSATRVINIINNASAADNTVIIDLNSAINATIVDGTFTLTILHIQTITVTWSSSSASTSSEFLASYNASMTVTTNDGNPLLVTATVDVDDTGGTATEGVDYDYTNPETIVFTSGTSSGTSQNTVVTILGSNQFDTIQFTLSNGVNCITSGVFELTLLPGGGA